MSGKPPRAPVLRWPVIAAVAATYFYFLLFAEFAFVELARPLLGSGIRQRLLLGLLAVGGIAGSGSAAACFRMERYRRSLTGAFVACGILAAGTLPAAGVTALLAIAVGIGASLGWLTVTLCTGLCAVAGRERLGLTIGLGTGIAYAACNLPWVFAADPRTQTVLAVVVAFLGALAAGKMHTEAPVQAPGTGVRRGWLAAGTLLFLALVWMDSAAFYIIQHTEDLRAAMWEGGWRLAGNAGAHLLLAIGAGLALDRRRIVWIPAVAFLCLATACLIIDAGGEGFPMVPLLYVGGVSLYSVALIHFPARTGRPGPVAVIFIVGGWIGSALGIGMAQDLHWIPPAFLVVAGVIFISSLFVGRQFGDDVAGTGDSR